MHLSNFSFYKTHLSAVTKPLKQHFPASWLLPGKQQPQGFRPLGKQEKNHGNTGLLPCPVHSSVPLSWFVFSVFSRFQSLPGRALCVSFLRDGFSIVIHAGPKAECIKATVGTGRQQYLPLLELILQIASRSLPSHPFGALPWMFPGALV